jgi:hypothetical protein
LLCRQLQQGAKQRLIMRARHAGRLEHLVIGVIKLIIQEWRRKRGWRRD